MTQEELTKVLEELQVKKAQAVRLADIYFIGPFMLWLSFRNTPSTWEKRILRVLGVGTIAYNLNNYRKQLAKIRQLTEAQKLVFQELKETPKQVNQI